MNVKVTPLRMNGRRIPKHRRVPGIEGLLIVYLSPDHDGTMRRHAIMNRTNKRGDTLERVLGPLYDPTLMAADAKGMLFRGLEVDGDGREMAQEWWVRLMV